MNKFKVVIVLLFLCSTFSLSAAKKSVDSVSVAKPADTTLGIHPWEAPNYMGKQGNWSINFEAGISLFDGDIHQDKTNIIPKTKADLTLGIGVEYSITPTWGVAAEYYYAPYRVDQANGTSESYLRGTMQAAELLFTYDLIDAWFPRRNKSIFSWYLLVGAGMAWYNCTLYNPTGIQIQGIPIDLNGKPASTTGNPAIEYAHVSREADEKTYDMCAIIPLGMAFEFNISRSLALGVKGMYRMHTKDNLDSYAFSTPIKTSVQNDYMEFVTANIRWKFPARKSDHVRNYRYKPEKDEQFDAVVKQIEYLAQAQPNQMVTSRIDTIYSIDTIYVISKTEGSTSHSQYIERVEHQVSSAQNDKLPPYIYFDSNKYKVLDESMGIIRQVAAKMIADPSLCVELRAFGDNTGSAEYNKSLSDKRAKAVRRELTRTYDIDPNRILTNGQGKIGAVGSYRPNRRVEIHFMSKEEFAKVSAAANSTSEVPVVVTQQPTDSEVAALMAEKQNLQAVQNITFDEPRVYTEFVGEEVITGGQTLARLARKYYGEGVFWVYIYEANKSKIKNPNRISSGLELQIPVLPKELIDATNAKSMEYAKELEDKYARR